MLSAMLPRLGSSKLVSAWIWTTLAVSIVAQAVWGMARTLCPDRERASIAVLVALAMLLSTSSTTQIVAIEFLIGR